MALITCAECGKEISDQAATCPHCGKPRASSPAEAKAKADRKRQLILLCVLIVALVVGLGKVRVVSGVEGYIVPRENFGYSDAFASISDCTSGPMLSVMATHGPLCRDLQRAGHLESDAMRSERINREMESRLEEIRRKMR